MTIIGGSIPCPVKNIDATQKARWNAFSFRIGSSKVTITIPPGLYTSETLFTKLRELLNAAASLAGSENTFDVGFAPASDTLKISRLTGSDPYGFLFGSGLYVDSIDKMTRSVLQIGSPALLLGFTPGINEMSDDAGIIIAPNSLDLSLLTSRIYLYLNYDSTQNLQTYVRGLGRSSPSAIIHLDDVREGRKYLNKETYMPLIVSRVNEVSRIHAFDLGFEDFFGNPVDFGNKEVSLIVEMECLY